MRAGPEHRDGGGLARPGAVLWLEEALRAESPPEACPPLAGVATADVAIVGGGFTGLWTALHLRLARPDLRVTLLEATACGFGASGRNGGWASGWQDELEQLLGCASPAGARFLLDECAAAISGIQSFCAAWEIDCHWRQRGALWVASSPEQRAGVSEAVATCAASGRPDLLEAVEAGEVARRTGSCALGGGARLTDAAAVHPGLLVRGLRRVAIRLGVQIHEGSPVLSLDQQRGVSLLTPAGRVDAGAAIVALGAWTATLLPEVSRALVVVPSYVVATEPLGRRMEPFTLAEGELVCDAQSTVHYAQVTRAGRLVFGRGGLGPLGWRSRPSAGHFADPSATDSLAEDVARWFPYLDGAAMTHAWGGPVDRSPSRLPIVGTSERGAGRVYYAAGYSGNGVAPSFLVGKILASLVCETGDAYATCALVGRPTRWFPPEPLRSLGGELVRRGALAADDREADGRRAPRLETLARRTSTRTLPGALGPIRGRIPPPGGWIPSLAASGVHRRSRWPAPVPAAGEQCDQPARRARGTRGMPTRGRMQ